MLRKVGKQVNKDVPVDKCRFTCFNSSEMTKQTCGELWKKNEEESVYHSLYSKIGKLMWFGNKEESVLCLLACFLLSIPKNFCK